MSERKNACRDTAWQTGRLDGRRKPPRLLFGQMYEDPAIETALFPPGGHIFCIASAGCTALALADRGCRVTAVDINPAQVEYLRGRLHGEGLQEGEVERLLCRGRCLMSLCGLSRSERRRFLMLDDPTRQVEAWRSGPPFQRWKSALLTLLQPRWIGRTFGADFLKWLPKGFPEALCGRLERGWATHSNRRNPFAWRLLLGHAEPPDSPGIAQGPAELWALGCADAVEFLEASPQGLFDGFHLSNILDGAQADYAECLFRALRHAGAPWARMTLRSLAQPSSVHEEGWAQLDRSMLWGTVRVHSVHDGADSLLGPFSEEPEIRQIRLQMSRIVRSGGSIQELHPPFKPRVLPYPEHPLLQVKSDPPSRCGGR